MGIDSKYLHILRLDSINSSSIVTIFGPDANFFQFLLQILIVRPFWGLILKFCVLILFIRQLLRMDTNYLSILAQMLISCNFHAEFQLYAHFAA